MSTSMTIKSNEISHINAGKSEGLMFFGQLVGRIVIYSLVLVAITYLIVWDASIARSNNHYSENSVTELTQEVFLLFTISLLMYAGRKLPFRRSFLFSLAAMFTCALIRELDSFFDNRFFDGAWQLSVSVLFAVVLVFFVFRRDQIIESGIEFFLLPVSGMMVSAFLTVMVFSRLFGQQLLWQTLMGDLFLRSVKNAVEEGVELFGYYLFLITTVEYVLYLFKSKKGYSRIALI